jgi:hypothetical protein
MPDYHSIIASAISRLPSTADEAGDRFDSDCVIGTQFESSQAHHAVLRK